MKPNDGICFIGMLSGGAQMTSSCPDTCNFKKSVNRPKQQVSLEVLGFPPSFSPVGFRVSPLVVVKIIIQKEQPAISWKMLAWKHDFQGKSVIDNMVSKLFCQRPCDTMMTSWKVAFPGARQYASWVSWALPIPSMYIHVSPKKTISALSLGWEKNPGFQRLPKSYRWESFLQERNFPPPPSGPSLPPKKQVLEKSHSASTWRIGSQELVFCGYIIWWNCRSKKSRVVGPLANGLYLWLVNGGDPNHLLAGMILQVSTRFSIISKHSTGHCEPSPQPVAILC